MTKPGGLRRVRQQAVMEIRVRHRFNTMMYDLSYRLPGRLPSILGGVHRWSLRDIQT
jgi:hypothetical protein